ncbi:MAG: bifunctional (p)ppGpp synthetase/guanosine-3',5'-bis(diphosphate) 3'-pyrophosphohydrolase [Clostridia bacterium]|nr:bifunctional (p)ppGpp synthetase/guanosine-3',5'-bis(diphosphate) 3'-pyrophosphohydrolase [Clostridia bacterium]
MDNGLSSIEQYNSNFDRLKALLSENPTKYDIAKIEKAYLFAEKLHAGQYRVSGEPYIIHPIAVAEIVYSLGLDTDSICAALLHDTVEDCSVSLESIRKEFGSTIEMLVDGLTKLVKIPFDDKEEEHMENLRKMFLAMSKDIRVIFIKLCDRLHNMRTLSVRRDEKRRNVAHETMQVYAPLAHRLGMQRIKQELENLSLSFLDPIGYAEVKADIDEKYGQNRDFITRTKEMLSEKLDEYHIDYSLEGRVKSVYSIYRKMFNQNKSFDEIYDFYAVRIITQTELDCYTVLGLIHDAYKSVPGRFKDYISTPKPNMYQSLHTTVIGRDGIPFEVQIRTRKMHQIAEYGVAAHWKYKSGDRRSSEEIDTKLEWIAKLIETEDNTRDPDEFLRALKVDIFHDEVFVFTPKGDVVALPQGATLIDFAYAIHSGVGNSMIGAKVNGIISPIDRSPHNGDIVEILTSSSSKGPKRNWLNTVKTGEARNKIRQWFKKEKRPENIVVGRSEIEKEFRHFGRPYNAAQRDEILSKIASRMGFQTVDDLLNTIGYGGLSVSKIQTKLRDEFDKVVKPIEQVPTQKSVPDVEIKTAVRRRTSSSGVIVDGLDGCEVKFAKCCNPLPGDKIIGFITRGSGVSVHKRDCINVVSGLKKPEKVDRFISIFWEEAPEEKKQDGLYESFIQVFAENDIQLIASITSAIAEMRVMLYQINTHSRDNDITVNLVVGCKNIEHFKSIMARLRMIDHVFDVRRGYM